MAPGDDADAAQLRISVAFSPCAQEVDEVGLRLGADARVADALVRSGLQQRHPSFDLASMPVGVWGARCDPTQRLREGDRVEVYRPLAVDPKEARRLRYRDQIAKPPLDVPQASTRKPRR